MAITQSLNSKANIKKLTSSDTSPSAPPASAIASSYYATSSASQAVINLPFSISASGVSVNTDIFWLFIDGKKLRLGAGNDYVFTSIVGDLSSQVTLAVAIPANLNIQAFKFRAV